MNERDRAFLQVYARFIFGGDMDNCVLTGGYFSGNACVHERRDILRFFCLFVTTRILPFIILLCVVMVSIGCATVAVDRRAALAKESEQFAAQTAKTQKATPELVVQKVNRAAQLLHEEGNAAFDRFRGKGSEFIFAGTYVWIHDINGIMRMHPIKYKMEGNFILGMKDSNGKAFFAEMNSVAKSKGRGWVEYAWPKPGESKPSTKVSYVKLVEVGDKKYIVGCGIYDFTKQQAELAAP